MSLHVLKPGLLTTIQDLGRKGFQKHGVIVSGAMDSYSFRIANWLVGNQENEAALEITLMGPTLKIEEDCLIAITGANLSPTIEGHSVPMWKPIYVQKGNTLKFGRCHSGCRAYLAVAGGYAIPEIMNSKSTYLKGKIGGYKGRALQAGDVISFNKYFPIQSDWKIHKKAFSSVNWSVFFHEYVPFRPNPVIRFIKGSQYEYFTDSSKRNFVEKSFVVSNQSDRMGYQISGPELQLQDKRELFSEAVTNGSVQVPPNGNPIILLSDHQTTGGYPKIAQIITIDLPLIAQVRPGQSIRFSLITLKEAEQLYLQKEQKMKELKIAISFALENQSPMNSTNQIEVLKNL